MFRNSGAAGDLRSGDSNVTIAGKRQIAQQQVMSANCAAREAATLMEAGESADATPVPVAAAAPAPVAAPAAATAAAKAPVEIKSAASPDWPAGTAMKTMTVREALREAMAEEMRANPNVFLMGEEVGEYQGAYKISQGLLDEFGPKRVVDTPITEHGFAGIAVGAG